jgi:hypothetical protein
VGSGTVVSLKIAVIGNLSPSSGTRAEGGSEQLEQLQWVICRRISSKLKSML